ncbi:hypothetical protein ACFIJ5_11645 [Haloimpatiens sp. FM7330]
MAKSYFINEYGHNSIYESSVVMMKKIIIKENMIYIFQSQKTE